MPADSGNPDPNGSPSDGSSRRSRTCQVLFVLGSGFDPSEQADSLATEFRSEHESLKFSKAETVIQTAEEWQADDKAGFRKSVATVVKKWCRDQAASFDPKRLLVSDYQDDDGRQFAVAGYFPRRKSSSSESTSETDIPQQHSDSEKSDNDDSSDDRTNEPLKFVLIAQQWLEKAKAHPPKRLAMIAGGLVALLVLAIVLPMLLSAGDGEGIAQSDPGEQSQAQNSDSDNATASSKIAPPVFPTGIVRVYTPEPGFAVMVDGEPVRDAQGEFVTTPCAVTAEQGARSITVFREGAFDLSRIVDVTEDSEITLEPSNDGSGGGSDILKAPHLNAEVGVPIALASLNSSRQFASWIIDQQIRDRKTLVRNLALDRQARDRFYHLFDGIEHIPSREKTLASAREILAPENETKIIQRRLAMLRRGEIDLNSLSGEERNELKRQLTLNQAGDAP